MIEFNIDYLNNVCQKIAPIWALENSVAVNPYWGLRYLDFLEASKVLYRNGNIKMYMPPSYYLQKIQSGEISNLDIRAAIIKNASSYSDTSLKERLSYYEQFPIKPFKLKTFAEYIDEVNQTDIQSIIINETSARMSVYFDKYGDYFPANEKELYYQWHKDATIDLMPEIMGLKNFRSFIKKLPEDLDIAIEKISFHLSLSPELQENYLHTLLLNIPGWASYLSGLDWDNHLANKKSNYLPAFLVILLCWENYLINHFPEHTTSWKEHLKNTLNKMNDKEVSEYFDVMYIIQQALEISVQKKIISDLSIPQKHTNVSPEIQMAFCIDVRSEVIRRCIEETSETIETIGVAGFFGFPLKYFPVNNNVGKKQCPVLIPSQYEVYEKPVQGNYHAYLMQRKIQDAVQYFKVKFRTGVVTGFSYVSPLGLFYLPKLITDSIGITRPVDNPKKSDLKNLLDEKTDMDLSHISIDDQLKMARFLIQAMGITNRFSNLIVLVGHGSSSVNNPHATSLDCGACGGNSGEINAIFGATILNNPIIRQLLKKENIFIPDDTYFIAGLHDTTTEEISLLRTKHIPEKIKTLVIKLNEILKKSSAKSRNEKRSLFKNENFVNDTDILKRAYDWSQVRPEWGLAGCHSFIIAPRGCTKHLNLNGKVFLHNYNYKEDKDCSLLENLMTAPMLVTNWINMQYYASTTDVEKLGGGHKPLHNPVSGLGVLEGSTGDLRIGLPFQSVNDGKNWQHLPVRLNVFIQAPKDAVVSIIQKHQVVRDLLNHEWMYLFLLNEEGKAEYQYTQNCIFSEINYINDKT